MFQSLDGDVLAKALGEFARGTGESGHSAIDGKTLKGSRRRRRSLNTRRTRAETDRIEVVAAGTVPATLTRSRMARANSTRLKT